MAGSSELRGRDDGFDFLLQEIQGLRRGRLVKIAGERDRQEAMAVDQQARTVPLHHPLHRFYEPPMMRVVEPVEKLLPLLQRGKAPSGCLPPSELHLISAPENRGPPQ